MEPIIMIIGCEKYKSNLMRAIERMRLPDCRVIGVIGTTDPTTFDGTILSLHVEDSYEYLPKKVYIGICWLYMNFPDTVGIFKTDDDIFFNDYNQLHREIINNQDVPFWGIHVSHCGAGPVNVERIIRLSDNKEIRPEHPSAHYCYGHGYWISKEAIPAVCCSEDFDSAFLEDVCMGHVLNKVGFIPKHVVIPYQEKER
jgi:hypothetical protein